MSPRGLKAASRISSVECQEGLWLELLRSLRLRDESRKSVTHFSFFQQLGMVKNYSNSNGCTRSNLPRRVAPPPKLRVIHHPSGFWGRAAPAPQGRNN